MSTFSAYLLAVVLQVTVITVLALTIVLIVRRRAVVRHAVGVIGLSLSLGAPLTVLLLPRPAWMSAEPRPPSPPNVPDMPPQPHVASEAPRLREAPTSAPAAVDPTTSRLPAVAVGSDWETVERDPGSAIGELHQSEAALNRQLPLHRPSVLGLLDWILSSAGLIWMVGTAWAFARLWRSHRAIRGLIRSLPTGSPESLLADETEICSTLGLAKLPPVLLSDQVPVPVILGTRCPVIVIPQAIAATGGPGQMIRVILHEAAHIARRDPWILLAQQVTAALYWWHPGVHALNRQINRAREEICDNYVLRRSEPAEYAEMLLELAERGRGSRFALGLFSTRWHLEDRISGLLNPRRDMMTRIGRGQFAALGLVLAAPCFLTGGIGLFATGVLGQTVQPADEASANEPRMRTVTIRGRCVDDQSAPVAEALVRVFRRSSPIDPPMLVSEVRTDPEGRFTFKDLQTAVDRTLLHGRGDLCVTGKSEGRVSAFTWIDSDSDTVDVLLELKGNVGTLSGTVTDPAGRPLAGVTVFQACGLQHPLPGIRSAVTDAQGHYAITDLARWNAKDTERFDPKTGMGTVVVSCGFLLQHPDFALTTAQYTAIPQAVDVRLSPPAIVEGRVLDAVTGQPVANAVVSAQGVVRSGWYQTRADREGRYQLRMTKDHYNIWSEAEDRIPIAVKALQALPGQRVTGADIRLVKGGFVFGEVIDSATNRPATPAAGRPLRVAHYGPARPRTGAAVTTTVVNPDGSYRLRVAPGRNFIYLMNGTAHRTLTVNDGEEVRVDLFMGAPGVRQSFAENDPDVLLAEKLRRQADMEKENEQRRARGEAVPEPRRRGDTPVARLLDQLEEQNASRALFQDDWCRTLKELVELGPAAVPELIAELDATQDDRMLRCLGFVLRAIGDRRAVPALIRAIPKTLRRPGSDMGLVAKEADLIKFAQQHDLDERNQGNKYGFGRPVREICGALQKLTGQKRGEDQLFHVFLGGTAKQQRLKRELFQRTAKGWADWWESHWSEYVQDAAYSQVHLPEPAPEDPLRALQPGTHFRTNSGGSNWLLESVLNPESKHVFFDFDTGRVAGLPEKWHSGDEILARLDEIVAWAAREGFDLMGTEHISLEDGRRTFALQSIGLRAWELGKDRWKMKSDDLTLEELQEEGRPTERLLLHRDPETNAIAPQAIGSFLYITREGTPGLLFVGVEVQNDNLKPGGITTGDDELSPIAFRKGRRFAFTHLEELAGDACP